MGVHLTIRTPPTLGRIPYKYASPCTFATYIHTYIHTYIRTYAGSKLMSWFDLQDKP